MNEFIVFLSTAIACLTAFFGGFCLYQIVEERKEELKRKKKMIASQEVLEKEKNPLKKGFSIKVLQYCTQLSLKLSSGVIKSHIPVTSLERFSSGFSQLVLQSGYEGRISLEAFGEASSRIALFAALLGGVVGLIFSNLLAVIGLVIGLCMGGSAPYRALSCARLRRNECLEKDLSEMLEVVALGMRSGLSFDKSFEAYCLNFSNDLSFSCERAYQSWTHGFERRPEALRSLASSYQSLQFFRTIEAIIRSLHLGTSFASVLEAQALEARETHRAHLQEKVSKAPVKMMIPTAVLILPAMLLLVLGPILLELMQGF